MSTAPAAGTVRKASFREGKSSFIGRRLLFGGAWPAGQKRMTCSVCPLPPTFTVCVLLCPSKVAVTW